MKFYVNGTRRGLGKYIYDRLNVVESLEECDVFINCKHDGFLQVDLLYKACELGKRVINIGSYASDWIFHPQQKKYTYAIEKKALRDANSQLFDNGYNTTCLNLGYLDSESVEHITSNKMTHRSVVNNIEWILTHPHRVKEITITPNESKKENKYNDQVVKEIGTLAYDERITISDNLRDYSTMYANCYKQLHQFGQYDLEKVRAEVAVLLEAHELHDNQIMLQSLDGKDFYTGITQVSKIPEGIVENDFDKLNVHEDSEIARFINDLGITRARLLVLPEKTCYTFHFDPTSRIHLVVKTNEWAFMADEKWRLFHMPDDGYPWYVDTTYPHTAINSALEDRIHIMGRAPQKPYK
jgi:hypothetical protein